MERGPLGLIGSLYEAINGRDVEAVMRALHPSICYRMPLDPLGEYPVFAGHDGVRAFYRQMFEAFARYEVRLERMIELGNGAIAASGRWLLGTADGEERDIPFVHFWRVEQGLATAVELHDAQNPLRLARAGVSAAPAVAAG